MNLSRVYLKLLQYGALVVGIIFIIFNFLLNNGVYAANISPHDITYAGKVEYNINGSNVLQELPNCNGVSECEIFKATKGIAISSIVFGGLALIIILLRDTILKDTYRDHQPKGFIIILLFILVSIALTLTMPAWKINNETKFWTYKVTPVLFEFLSNIGYSCAFALEIYFHNTRY